MDERQQLNAGRAALFTLFIITVGALGVLIWEYVTTKNVTNVGAMIVMLASGGLYWLFERLSGAQAPRSIFGNELPTGQNAADRRIRRRSYVQDALLTAAGFTVLTIGGLALGDPKALDALPIGLTGAPALIAAGVLDFAITAAILFGLSLLVCEPQAKAVERRYAD